MFADVFWKKPEEAPRPPQKFFGQDDAEKMYGSDVLGRKGDGPLLPVPKHYRGGGGGGDEDDPGAPLVHRLGVGVVFLWFSSFILIQAL